MGHNGNWQQESVYMGKNLVTEFQLFLARTNGEKPREQQKFNLTSFFFQSNALSVKAGFSLTHNKSM